MFHLRRPTQAHVDAALAAARSRPFSYPEVGATRTQPPPRGYPTMHESARLGTGEALYRATVAAVRGWAMYRLPWTRLCPAGAPVEPGSTVLTMVHHLGFWSINPCRVVYVEEGGDAGVERFAFAIGTVPGHAERGEERFTVERRRADDSVWLDIFSFATARHPLVWAGYPIMRRLQRRFTVQAIEAVRRAAHEGLAA